MRRQCQLLDVPRSSAYYKRNSKSATNLELMRLMDVCFIQDPTLGVLGMQDELREHGHWYNVKRIRRLLRKMGVEPIYPRKNLSKLGKAEYIHPYLLRWRHRTDHNRTISNDYSHIAEGYKVTAELAAFLKETSGDADRILEKYR